MSQVAALIKTQEDKRAEQDALVEDKRQLVIDRAAELLETDIEGRNPYLWELFEIYEGGALEVPLSTYEGVEIKDRDTAWLVEHGSMLAAANYQAAFELAISDILDNAEKYGEILSQHKVSPAEIKAAMKRKDA